jgi:hypothetical protein
MGSIWSPSVVIVIIWAISKLVVRIIIITKVITVRHSVMQVAKQGSLLFDMVCISIDIRIVM